MRGHGIEPALWLMRPTCYHHTRPQLYLQIKETGFRRGSFIRLRLRRFRWYFRVIIQLAATPLVLLLSTPAGVYTNMTAFLRVRRSTRHATLFNVLSTASLASCSKALTFYVRLPVNNLHLASFGCLYYLSTTGLSHFHIAPDATLRF
jgi:hypothetical protein